MDKKVKKIAYFLKFNYLEIVKNPKIKERLHIDFASKILGHYTSCIVIEVERNLDEIILKIVTNKYSFIDYYDCIGHKFLFGLPNNTIGIGILIEIEETWYNPEDHTIDKWFN